ncbi:DUF6470 family protein [Bacillus testis]|uniref:DUF6470 family protein n=1 Tax=Bacillus testis TaxID=1622072 RepID=UPI00067E8F0E|nr:DUF6470 family protein [Bacillus testis]
MRIPQIRLESQSAMISIQTNDAELELQQPQAELDIQQPKAEMSLERTPARLTIDQTAAWEAMGFKSISRSSKEYATNGKQELMEGMARRTQEGDALMKIENGGNPIQQIAKQNSERTEIQFNIGFIPPIGSVKLEYEPAKVDIDWQIHKPIVNAKTNKPIGDYRSGNVDIDLRQKNSLTIDFVSEEI